MSVDDPSAHVGRASNGRPRIRWIRGGRASATVTAIAIFLTALSCVSAAAADDNGPTLAQIRAAQDKLRPLHKKLGKPEPGDWLASHLEPGQTFDEYLKSDPVTPTGKRRVIYLQPLGEFDAGQNRILKLTGEYLGLVYNRPVKVLAPIPLSVIPEKARRKHPTWGMSQILTTYVMNDLLPKRLPEDGASLIALTTSDLWPGEGWNFVFGQASLRDRVGVWSIYRNGKASGSRDEFRLCLRRTLKTASHELGHMFSMEHCTRYECNMCGSNNRDEADRLPLANCPECAAKIWWATGADPKESCHKLAEFCERTGLKDDARFYRDSAAALAGSK